MTVYKGIKTSGARFGQWIAITGAGGGLGHLGDYILLSFPLTHQSSDIKQLAVQYAVAQGLRVVAIGKPSFPVRHFDLTLMHALAPSDTGAQKKELVMNLGAEKWIDFKESKDLIADVQAATGGPGPQAAIIATGNVSLVKGRFANDDRLTCTRFCSSARAIFPSCNVPQEHWNTHLYWHAGWSGSAEYPNHSIDRKGLTMST